MKRIAASLLLLAAQASPAADPAAPVPVAQEPMHRLVFHNDQVNALDVLIPAHAQTRYHTHLHDLAGLTVSSSPTREEPLGQPPTTEPVSPENEVWFEPYAAPVTHRVTNLGDKPVHYLMFQLLHAAQDAKLAPAWTSASHGATVLENRRVRAIKITLAPGEASADHAHSMPFGVVLATRGELQDGDAPARRLSQPAIVAWKAATEHHRLRNTGDQQMEVLEFEFQP